MCWVESKGGAVDSDWDSVRSKTGTSVNKSSKQSLINESVNISPLSLFNPSLILASKITYLKKKSNDYNIHSKHLLAPNDKYFIGIMKIWQIDFNIAFKAKKKN